MDPALDWSECVRFFTEGKSKFMMNITQFDFLNQRNSMITRCSNSIRNEIFSVWGSLKVHFNFKLYFWWESL
jgi:hypothetical protein